MTPKVSKTLICARPRCGQEFTTTNRRQRYCCPDCQERNREERLWPPERTRDMVQTVQSMVRVAKANEVAVNAARAPRGRRCPAGCEWLRHDGERGVCLRVGALCEK